MGWITDLIRNIFWGLGKLCLIASDWFMGLIKIISNINVADQKDILIFMAICWVFVASLTFLRGLKLYWDYHEKGEMPLPIDLFNKRVVKMALATVFVPLLLSFTIAFVGWSVSSANSWLNLNNDLTPSTMMLSNTATTPLQTNLTEMQSNVETVTLDAFNINTKVGSIYLYYTTWDSFWFGIAVAFFLLVAMVKNFTTYFGRFIYILAEFITSPIAITSLLSESDTIFNQSMNNLFTSSALQGVQLFTFSILFYLFGSHGLFGAETAVIRSIFLIVSLFCVDTFTSAVAKKLGTEDVSQKTSRGIISGITGGLFAGYMAAQGAFSAVKAGANVASGVTSFAGQKAGEKLGGKNQSIMEQNVLSNMGNGNGPGGFGSPTGTNGPTGNSVLENSAGINAVQSPVGATALAGDVAQMAGASSPLGLGLNAATKIAENNRVSRKGSFARNFADQVENMTGVKGTLGRATAKVSKHAYIGLSNRYSKTALRKTTRGMEHRNQGKQYGGLINAQDVMERSRNG